MSVQERRGGIDDSVAARCIISIGLASLVSCRLATSDIAVLTNQYDNHLSRDTADEEGFSPSRRSSKTCCRDRGAAMSSFWQVIHGLLLLGLSRGVLSEDHDAVQSNENGSPDDPGLTHFVTVGFISIVAGVASAKLTR